MYGKEENNQILGLYYLILWKSYLKKESTWKLSTTVMHLRKLINTYHKEHLEKLIMISLALDFDLLIARPIILKEHLKQKHNCAYKRANKRGRNEGVVLKSLKQ